MAIIPLDLGSVTSAMRAPQQDEITRSDDAMPVWWLHGGMGRGTRGAGWDVAYATMYTRIGAAATSMSHPLSVALVDLDATFC